MNPYESLELRIFIAKRKLKELTTFTFQFRVRGKVFQGFVVRKNGRFFAYQNLCRHLPITLDLNDNKIVDQCQKYLQCHMHGAQYEIETGFCIAGPCIGASLIRLEIKEEAKRLVILIPKNFGQS